MDKITLKNMVFYAYHGTESHEQKGGQKFQIDVEMSLDLSKAIESDSLEDTVSYPDVYTLIKGVVQKEQFNLIESLANAIALAILENFHVGEVTVRIRKPGAIIGGILDYPEIEITRGK